MGRHNAVSLPYFELDCHMDDKVKLIQAEFGLKGFAVVVKLYQRIYGGEFGYYCEWDEERSLLFALENGLNGDGKNLINDVVSACIKRDVFSEKLFREYGILTSHGVQKQYLKATAKREAVELKKEYLLLTVPKNRRNVVINSISGGRNAVSGAGNTQSKVKESRQDNTIIFNTMCKADALALFEKLWVMYPLKKGKGRVSDAQKMKLYKIGFDEMSRAVRRYIQYVDSVSYLHYQNGSTFFNSGYVDYLDANYSKQKNAKPANRFNDFEQREYDCGKLEKALLGVGNGGDGT